MASASGVTATRSLAAMSVPLAVLIYVRALILGSPSPCRASLLVAGSTQDSD